MAVGGFDIADAFRSSLDHSSIIGENVVIEEKDGTVDNPNTDPIASQPNNPVNTPETPESPRLKSPPILETPKQIDEVIVKHKPQTLFKLSLTKNKDDVFVKPSPVAELMSPAKMLQFEIDLTNSSTPTMKRAAIDFNFFNKNNFEEYFTDVPKVLNNPDAETEGGAFIETPVIVKADTIRHEIGYGIRATPSGRHRGCLSLIMGLVRGAVLITPAQHLLEEEAQKGHSPAGVAEDSRGRSDTKKKEKIMG
ncbi:unnamed protein product, partial [Iphiclides podalirius]